MSANSSKADFMFDCIVERRQHAIFGGRFGIILALMMALIALAAMVPAHRATGPAASLANRVRAA